MEYGEAPAPMLVSSISKRIAPILLVMVLPIVYFNWLYFYHLGVGPLVSPDTVSYIEPDPTRTVGYFLFFKLISALNTNLIPAIQLNLFFVGCFALGLALAHLTKRVWLGMIVCFLIACYQNFHLSSFYILTDSLFSSTILLIIAMLALILTTQQKRYALMFGTLVGAAVALRPAGYFLLGLVVLIWLLPRHIIDVRSRTLIALPVALILGAMSTYNYLQFGFFSSQSFGGISLVGQLAPKIGENSDGQYPVLSSRIQDRLAPILRMRTQDASFSVYQQESSADYNELLWENLIPEVQNHIKEELEDDPEDFVLVNEISSTLAWEAIEADPRWYIRHVGVHAYAMLNPVFRVSPLVRDQLKVAVDSSNAFLESVEHGKMGIAPWGVPVSQSRILDWIDVSLNRSWSLLSVYRTPLLAFLILLALSYPVVFLWPNATEADVFVILIAAASFGYVIQMALAQVAITRYGLPAIPMLTVSSLVGVVIWVERVVYGFKDLLRTR